MCADVSLAIEGFGTAPDADVVAFFGLGFLETVFGFGIDPLFYVDVASAVVECVGYVCGLRVYAVDLADECDLDPRS